MPEIKNNLEEAPFSFYLTRFQALDPAAAAARCGVVFDGEAFSLCLLGREYRLAFPSGAIAPDAPTKTQTFLMRRLTDGRSAPFRGSFLTFREMPWGELYIKPFTGRCLTRAAFSFGAKLSAFAAACEAMGAKKLPYGDVGYEFELLPDFRMRLLVWAGDDEFPPNAQLLFSDNFIDGFAAEDRVVAGDLLITAIKERMTSHDL